MADDSELRGPRSSRTIAKAGAGAKAIGGGKSKVGQGKVSKGGVVKGAGEGVIGPSKSGKTAIGNIEIGLIAKVRKPIPPPTRVAEDERKYSRARERERSRRGK